MKLGSLRKPRSIPLRGVAGLLGVVALALLLASCGPQPDETLNAASAQEPDAHFADLTRQEYRSGKLSMRIQAREASWYEDEQRLEISGLSFINYNTEDGTIAATGEADTAIFHETSGDAEFSGFVHVVSADGDVSFETTQITYKRALDVFEASDGTEVLIKAKNQLMMAGNGLLFDVKQKYYEIRSGVNGSVYQ